MLNPSDLVIREKLIAFGQINFSDEYLMQKKL